MQYIKQIIREVAARENMKTEQMILRQPAEAYKMKKALADISSSFPGKMTSREKKEFEKMTSALDSMIPGNTD